MKDNVRKTLDEMWHPTTEWVYFVALVLKELLPREHGAIPIFLRIIREMMPSSNLTLMGLSKNKITNAEVTQLAMALPYSRIEQIWLNNNNISDYGLMKLAEILPRSRVTTLYIENNRITDAGAIALAEILHKSKLESISIGGNRITDMGIEILIDVFSKMSVCSECCLVSKSVGFDAFPLYHGFHMPNDNMSHYYHSYYRSALKFFKDNTCSCNSKKRRRLRW